MSSYIADSISGAKGRDQRPGLDAMMKMVRQGRGEAIALSLQDS
jgi:hypothetical protein